MLRTIGNSVDPGSRSTLILDSINTRFRKARATYKLKHNGRVKTILFGMLNMMKYSEPSRAGFPEIMIDFIMQVNNMAFAHISMNATATFAFPHAALIIGRIKRQFEHGLYPRSTGRHAEERVVFLLG